MCSQIRRANLGHKAGRLFKFNALITAFGTYVSSILTDGVLLPDSRRRPVDQGFAAKIHPAQRNYQLKEAHSWVLQHF